MHAAGLDSDDESPDEKPYGYPKGDEAEYGTGSTATRDYYAVVNTDGTLEKRWSPT